MLAFYTELTFSGHYVLQPKTNHERNTVGYVSQPGRLGGCGHEKANTAHAFDLRRSRQSHECTAKQCIYAHSGEMGQGHRPTNRHFGCVGSLADSNETKVTVDVHPKTIHDFGGFPKALFDMQYPAPGAPEFAKQAASLLAARGAKPSEDWGLDHGAWTVLHFLYPKADIPVFQVSIDYAQGGEYHLAVGKALSALRDQGVLILASGNVVHNLRHVDMHATDGLMASRPWAQSFDSAVKAALLSNDSKALADYQRLDAGAQLAAQTPDHYWPLLYALGAARDGEAPKFIFEGFQLGTLSMRCVQWG
jgi:4,5-DOPA dioxygenase extradiol